MSLLEVILQTVNMVIRIPLEALGFLEYISW